MRNHIELLIPLALVGCAGEAEPEMSTLESSLVQASITAPSPSPALFERMQARDDQDVATAQLNFELRLVNTGMEMAVLDRADLSYSGAAALAPQISRADLRKFYLDDCDRAGFGIDRSGSLSLDLPAFTAESIRDVATVNTHAYLSVTGSGKRAFPHGLLDVTSFVVARLKEGNVQDWTTVVPFFGFQDRATAMTAAPDALSYVVVGAARPVGSIDDPYDQPFRFAAARIGTDGKPVKRPDDTLWQRSIPFAGCTAEAIDVVRAPLTGGRTGYFIAGNASCGGDRRVAVAMLDQDGNLFGGFGGGAFVIDPGAAAARVGAVALDPVTNDLYVVGSLGDDVMVIKLDPAGALVAGYGAGGIRTFDGVSHDQMMGWDAKVMNDGRLAIATTSRRVPANAYHLGMLRLQANGAPDPLLPGGFTAVGVPGLAHAYGRGIEIHENETWFTISGYGDNGTKRRMVAAAFTANGSLRMQFDGDGFLVAGPTGPAPAYASSLDGDYITLGGANGSVLGGARFHRKDGTPDDPSVLGVGEECALVWPDSGVLPEGATHVMNEWNWDALPNGAAVDLSFLPFAGGTSVTYSWSGQIEAPANGFPFPGRAQAEANTYWKINHSHDVMDAHRRAFDYRPTVDKFINKQRYAYDIGMVRWNNDTQAWTNYIDGADGDQNDEYVVHGKAIYPMANGVITHCASGVAENAAPGIKDVKENCNESGIPCLYAIGGNYFRIQHDDGSTSYYAHLQNDLDPELCPAGNNGPVPLLQQKTVETTTKLGVVGNSGNSTGPHLHLEYSVAWDATDAAKDVYDYADGRPLLFDNVRGVRLSLTPDELPSHEPPFPVAAQWGSTLLVMTPPPPDNPLNDNTTCLPININGADLEARQADGNAGPTLYCPGDTSVCVLNGEGGSDCQPCEEGPYPGCPCNADDQCGSMTCWGDTFSASTLSSPTGFCYPHDDLPVWSCGYDCRANLGEGAWCYNDFASSSGRARCLDALTTPGELGMCWEQGYLFACTADPDDNESCVEHCMCENGYSWDNAGEVNSCESLCQPSTTPAYDGECIVECLSDADCHINGGEGWNYPSEYQCDNDVGVPVCRIPL